MSALAGLMLIAFTLGLGLGEVLQKTATGRLVFSGLFYAALGAAVGILFVFKFA